MRRLTESWLYDKRPDGSVRCNVCALRCVIPPGKRGSCGSRRNRGGTLYTALAGLASSACVDAVEKKPLFHLYPGSRVYSLGAVGCCFRCPGCQNWEISHEVPERFGRGMLRIGPAEAADRAHELGCEGIAWTYNDPAIWIEQTVPGARRAAERGLFCCYVTNGYVTPEHLGMIGPYLTAWRVDLKGFSRATYKRISGVARWEPVLEMTRLAARKYSMHVECVTNVTPSINDDESELRDIARWIRSDLGPDTPWHVTRFHSYLGLSHLPPTPVRMLERAREIGMEEGLRFVYLGNVPGHPWENTWCPGCGSLVIRRTGARVNSIGLLEGTCRECGRKIPGRWRTRKVRPEPGSPVR